MNYRRRMMLFDALVVLNHWGMLAVIAVLIGAAFIWPNWFVWSCAAVAVLVRILAGCAVLAWFFDEYTALQDDDA